MLQARPGRFRNPLALVSVIVALLVAADIVFAAVLFSRGISFQVSPAANQSTAAANHGQAKKAKAHPCNHGYYVSQAAHSGRGEAYVEAIAQSNLGKDGNCSAPLPARAPSPAPKPSGS